MSVSVSDFFQSYTPLKSTVPREVMGGSCSVGSNPAVLQLSSSSSESEFGVGGLNRPLRRVVFGFLCCYYFIKRSSGIGSPVYVTTS